MSDPKFQIGDLVVIDAETHGAWGRIVHTTTVSTVEGTPRAHFHDISTGSVGGVEMIDARHQMVSEHRLTTQQAVVDAMPPDEAACGTCGRPAQWDARLITGERQQACHGHLADACVDLGKPDLVVTRLDG